MEKLGEEDADAEPCCGGEGGETAAAGLAAKISSCLGRAGRFGYQAQALSSDLDIGPVGPLGLPGPRHVWALDVLGFFMMYGRPALETDRAKFAANSRAIRVARGSGMTTMRKVSDGSPRTGLLPVLLAAGVWLGWWLLRFLIAVGE